MGVVLAASSADVQSLGARLADRTVCIGPPPAAKSYLQVPRLIAAAQMTGCDAIHPGYGFLAESPDLADACNQAGITFVGPSARLLRMFGDKLTAREAAVEAGVPVSEASVELPNPVMARSAADRLGYPVILKPVRGGGGKGMRIVEHPDALQALFTLAAQEAEAAFGDGRLYLERWIPKARHVEVQIAGDGMGKAVHFGDRDCSVQRRQQKLIEEAPAPSLPTDLQEALRTSAVALCESVAYESVGTVEFLVDVDRENYYFLEVNPRIQVEHGVTELVTGVDLIELQFQLAAGSSLPWTQDQIRVTGSAVECRLNAEDPDRGFLPSPGRILEWDVTLAPGIRVDSHCEAGYQVPPFYDSLLAKVMAHADDRASAIELLDQALSKFRCTGVKTTTSLMQRIIRDPDFHRVRHHTRWLDTEVEITTGARDRSEGDDPDEV